MDKCWNCRRECNTQNCPGCSRKVCKVCSYSELHDCPNIVEEIERDMNKFKEKLQLIDT